MRIAILLAALLLSPSVEAAAVDCAKATEPHDKAICADPTLRQLDADLAAAYETLAAGAAAAGADRVRLGEHDRHAYIQELCTPADAGCLASAYRQALSSVAKFASPPAGLVPIERFRLHPTQKPAFPKTSVVTASPRLDRPAEPWADGFEKAARLAAADLKPEDGETDAVIDYRPTYLAPDLAAVAFAVWTYPHGAAHGMSRQTAFDYLPTQQRRLQATDLFESGTTWSGFLAERAFDGLKEQAKAGSWELTVGGPGELEKPVAEPANWLVRPDGLGLYFAPASIGPYVAGEHEVLIPWADLKPYLSAAPAFAIPTN
ncbi:MAG TPA: DUF3298 domain-containing protein [Aliidongia sp.]|nr:DUF3298 domain-containing protein [Aliidongia sp.]